MLKNKPKIKLLAFIGSAMVLMHILNMLTQYNLNQYGIEPRAINRLPMILSSPWLHGSFSHLLNNLTALLVLSGLCLIRSVRFYLNSSAFIIIVGGLFVWLFGRSALHIGASGWVFGLWALHIALAVFERKWLNIGIATLVVLLYGGLIWGVFPNQPGVSFEAHIGGALAGVFWAFFYSQKRPIY